jgi:hypothetical protein
MNMPQLEHAFWPETVRFVQILTVLQTRFSTRSLPCLPAVPPTDSSSHWCFILRSLIIDSFMDWLKTHEASIAECLNKNDTNAGSNLKLTSLEAVGLVNGSDQTRDSVAVLQKPWPKLFGVLGGFPSPCVHVNLFKSVTDGLLSKSCPLTIQDCTLYYFCISNNFIKNRNNYQIALDLIISYSYMNLREIMPIYTTTYTGYLLAAGEHYAYF